MTPLLLVALLAADPALIADLRSDAAAARLRAVQQVERLGAEGTPDAAYLAPLAALLRDPDAQTRGLAALAISRHVAAVTERVPPEVVAPLAVALRDDTPHVAAFAARALQSLGDRALPDLRAAAAPKQPQSQRLAALEAAYRLSGLP
jgi:HEAT repeat protein